jgi:hypothetical protein
MAAATSPTEENHTMNLPASNPTPENLTLSQLFDLERRARNLWNEALAYGMANPSFDNEDIFFRSFKARITALVGFDATTPIPALRSSDAYNLLYHAVMEALHCRTVYQGFVQVVAEKGNKPGQAAFMFKNRFGMFPRFKTRSKFKAYPGGRS